MEWLIVLMLIVIGAVLVLLEFLVFPGVNVVGLLGFICIIAGIYFGYSYYGHIAGHFILLATAVFGGGVTWYVLRTNTWKKLSLHTRLEGTVEGVDVSVEEGDLGKTLGRLAPMGNVMVRDMVVEAESQSGYIDENREVVVIKVYKNKIVVKLKTV
ncbi:MAG: hypothetical protein RR397_03635 [Odoribacter sp.]